MKFIKIVAIVLGVLVLGIAGLATCGVVLVGMTEPTISDTPAEAAEDGAGEPAATEVDPGAPEYTGAQENAISKAEDYLAFSAFSKAQLVDQLEYEGFTNADAKFAVNHIDVNWTEQAKAKAEDYLEFSAFSCSGLIEQLEFEQFTPKQALAGASSTEACEN